VSGWLVVMHGCLYYFLLSSRRCDVVCGVVNVSLCRPRSDGDASKLQFLSLTISFRFVG